MQVDPDADTAVAVAQLVILQAASLRLLVQQGDQLFVKFRVPFVHQALDRLAHELAARPEDVRRDQNGQNGIEGQPARSGHEQQTDDEIVIEQEEFQEEVWKFKG